MHILMIIALVLSTSTSEVTPGDTFTVAATLYSDQIERHVLTLDLPLGFVVDGDPVRVVRVDGQHGETVTWTIRANASAVPRLAPYALGLRIDGALVASTAVRVCCAKWPHARRQIWLPLVAR